MSYFVLSCPVFVTIAAHVIVASDYTAITGDEHVFSAILFVSRLELLSGCLHVRTGLTTIVVRVELSFIRRALATDTYYGRREACWSCKICLVDSQQEVDVGLVESTVGWFTAFLVVEVIATERDNDQVRGVHFKRPELSSSL